MMNYGEEYAYWYLRLNGFFPLTNFVIHKSGEIQYSSDCDLLAVRPLHVFEEVGGQIDDWDRGLFDLFRPNTQIGLICEVKTGGYERAELFKAENLLYSLNRLGFAPKEKNRGLLEEFKHRSVIDVDDRHQVGKIFVSNKPIQDERFISISLGDVIKFLFSRVDKYPVEKYQDRMFFSSILIQSVIDMATLRKEMN